MKKVIYIALFFVVVLAGMMVLLPSHDPIGDVVVAIQEEMKPEPTPNWEDIRPSDEDVWQQIVDGFIYR